MDYNKIIEDLREQSWLNIHSQTHATKHTLFSLITNTWISFASKLNFPWNHLDSDEQKLSFVKSVLNKVLSETDLEEYISDYAEHLLNKSKNKPERLYKILEELNSHYLSQQQIKILENTKISSLNELVMDNIITLKDYKKIIQFISHISIDNLEETVNRFMILLQESENTASLINFISKVKSPSTLEELILTYVSSKNLDEFINWTDEDPFYRYWIDPITNKSRYSMSSNMPAVLMNNFDWTNIWAFINTCGGKNVHSFLALSYEAVIDFIKEAGREQATTFVASFKIASERLRANKKPKEAWIFIKNVDFNKLALFAAKRWVEEIPLINWDSGSHRRTSWKKAADYINTWPSTIS